MLLKESVEVRPYNTFKINAKARYFVTISDVEKLPLLQHYLHTTQQPYFLLGGGSNVLFTKDFDGVLVKNELKGIKVLSENDETVVLEVASGEIWSDLVDFCVSKGWGGIENLVSIPGTMGGATVQNIGAYGVEVASVIQSVKVFHLGTGEWQMFSQNELQYGYRSSIFKQLTNKELYVVSSTITLSKNPVLKTNYGAIQSALESQNITHPTIVDVRNVIAKIRSEKLPDVNVLGSAGSFFKNPEVSVAFAEKLQRDYPDIPIYPIDSQTVKLAAGWLIDRCGWRGFRISDAGVHEKQALVLVNHGNATPQEMLTLVEKVQLSVYQQFGVQLSPEVVLV